ncbi:MAG: hypothetical protein IT561_03795, partial [Alphaproteobacteria bacterium]|nr:hypothetical protein [Alphaproteobacteria bacterium]
MTPPSATEIARALDGAWRLACRDARGIDNFAGTPESVWKSFFAAVIVAPFFVLLLALRDMPTEPRGGIGAMILIEAIAYAANWAAFPLAMLYVSRLIGRERRWLLFVEAFNWSAVIQVVLFVIATAITAADLLPEALAQGVAFGVTLLVIVYEWFVARVALQV